MDGFFHGKPYCLMGWFGGISPLIFGVPSRYILSEQQFFAKPPGSKEQGHDAWPASVDLDQGP